MAKNTCEHVAEAGTDSNTKFKWQHDLVQDLLKALSNFKIAMKLFFGFSFLSFNLFWYRQKIGNNSISKIWRLRGSYRASSLLDRTGFSHITCSYKLHAYKNVSGRVKNELKASQLTSCNHPLSIFWFYMMVASGSSREAGLAFKPLHPQSFILNIFQIYLIIYLL